MGRKIIFRKFIEAKELVEATLRSKEFYDEDNTLVRKQYSALKEIYDYIKTDETWAGKQSRRKVIIFIKNRGNYEKTRDEIGSKSRNSIEVSMSYLSKKLSIKIGDNTIELLMEGRVEEAMIQFHTGTGKLNPTDYIIEGLLNLLPEPEKSYKTLEECKRELRLLLTLTKFNLEKVKKSYDTNHFSYLMYILTSTDIVVSEERKVLYQLLNGEFSRNAEGEVTDLNEQIAVAIETLSANGFR